MALSESDAALYRLYAVGLLTYDEALKQAQSEFHLRREMLRFDQNVAAAPVSFPRARESSGRSAA